MKQNAETNPNREKWNDFYRKEMYFKNFISKENHPCKKRIIPDKLPQNMKTDSSEKIYDSDNYGNKRIIWF